MIPPQTATNILTEISSALDIEMPDNEQQVKFYTAQIVNTIKAHQKKAEMYDELVFPLKKAINGRL